MTGDQTLHAAILQRVAIGRPRPAVHVRQAFEARIEGAAAAARIALRRAVRILEALDAHSPADRALSTRPLSSAIPRGGASRLAFERQRIARRPRPAIVSVDTLHAAAVCRITSLGPGQPAVFVLQALYALPRGFVTDRDEGRTVGVRRAADGREPSGREPSIDVRAGHDPRCVRRGCVRRGLGGLLAPRRSAGGRGFACAGVLALPWQKLDPLPAAPRKRSKNDQKGPYLALGQHRPTERICCHAAGPAARASAGA